MKEKLEKQIEEYTKQLEQAKVFVFKLQGAIVSLTALVNEEEAPTKKEDKKQEK